MKRRCKDSIFIKKYEQKYKNVSIIDIVKEIFSYADGCTMSAKKDAIANIGGFLCTNSSSLAEEQKNLLTWLKKGALMGLSFKLIKLRK